MVPPQWLDIKNYTPVISIYSRRVEGLLHIVVFAIRGTLDYLSLK